MFVREVISRFMISSDGARIAVVIFSSRAYVKLKLNEEDTVEGVLQRIDTLPFLGESRNLAAGLYAMNHIVFQPKNGDRSDADNIVFLITCGRSTANRDTMLYAKEAKDNGVKIIAIAVTIFDISELFTVVSPPLQQTLFRVIKVTQLVFYIDKVVVEISRPPKVKVFPTSLPPINTGASESITCISMSGLLHYQNPVILLCLTSTSHLTSPFLFSHLLSFLSSILL